MKSISKSKIMSMYLTASRKGVTKKDQHRVGSIAFRLVKINSQDTCILQIAGSICSKKEPKVIPIKSRTLAIKRLSCKQQNEEKLTYFPVLISTIFKKNKNKSAVSLKSILENNLFLKSENNFFDEVDWKINETKFLKTLKGFIEDAMDAYPEAYAEIKN